MPDPTAPRFAFTVSGLPDDTFQVVRFTGKEGLSLLYEFDVFLASPLERMNLDAIQSGRARLSMRRPGKDDLVWNGMVRDFQLLDRNHGMLFCRATLTPRAWWLTQMRTTQVFLDIGLRDLLDEILRQVGLQPGVDQEFRLSDDYARREWICQFGETHWNFLCRHMERAGLYFFFEQQEHREKLVITDTCLSHMPLPGEGALHYRPASGLTAERKEEHARAFRATMRQLPRDVRIQDYNYRTCKMMQGSHHVGGLGAVGVYAYEENLQSNAEAKRMARTKAEGLSCRHVLYHGESSAPFLRPGFTFELADHFHAGFNQSYTTLELTHEGHQEGLLAGQGIEVGREKPAYCNRFEAIPAKVQFRPEAKTPMPAVAGPITAWIDGEGDGKYAEVDAMGRYKVRFPMDLTTRGGGKASHWLRMVTPYGGDGHGMHFPLHKGTEVLVLFRNGNPDKPVIAGAVPNQTQRMVVNQDNSTQCRLTTAGGNLLHIEDMEGGQRFLLQTPVENSWLSIGAPNAASKTQTPPTTPTTQGRDWSTMPTASGVCLATGGSFAVTCQAWNAITLGEKSCITVGDMNNVIVGAAVNTVVEEALNMQLGPRQDIIMPELLHFVVNEQQIKATAVMMATVRSKISAQESAVHGEQEVVVGSLVNAFGDLQELAGIDIQVYGEVEEVAAQAAQTVANQDILAGNVNQAVGERNEAAGEVVQAAGGRTEMAGTLECLAGEEVRQRASFTGMAGETTELAGEASTIVGSFVIL